MSYKADFNLSDTQKFQKTLLDVPNNSLSDKAIKEIYHLKKHRNIKYNVTYCIIFQRIQTLALPILALLDIIYYTGKMAVSLILLRPKDAKYNLFACGKSMRVFCYTLVATVPALFDPNTYYRSQQSWLHLQRHQLRSEIKSLLMSKHKENPEKSQIDLFHDVIKFIVTKYASPEQANEILNKLNNAIIDQLPEDESKIEVAIDCNSELLTKLIMNLYKQNVIPDENFLVIFSKIVELKDPELKNRLTINLIKNYKPHSKDFEYNENALLPLYLTRQITDHDGILSSMKEAAQHKCFHDNIRFRIFIKTLLSIVESKISTKHKLLLLDSLVQLINTSQKPQPRAKKTNIEKRTNLQFQLEKKQRLIAKKEERIAQLQTLTEINIEKLQTEIVELNAKENKLRDQQKTTFNKAEKIGLGKQISETNKQKKEKENLIKKPIHADNKKAIDDLHENINTLQREIEGITAQLRNLPEDDPTTAVTKQADSEINLSTLFTTYGIILNLKDKNLIEPILNQIGSDKKYSSLLSQDILPDLFKSTFGIKEESFDLKYLLQTRNPNALLKFHLRLQQLDPKNREKALNLSSKLFMSVCNNTFPDLRYAHTENLHLKKIHDYSPELLTQWATLPENETVGSLLPETNSPFNDYVLMFTDDPTDILSIGNDTNSCVNLDGRLEKVFGMLSLVIDGKTQTLVARKNPKGPISAETQLQLMWDSQKKRPVLFLEKINFNGAASDNYPIINAMITKAKKRAEALNLDLVSCYENPDPKNPILKTPYSGSVQSLGSSSPVEFVNRFHLTNDGVYDIGKTQIVQRRQQVMSHSFANVKSADRESSDFEKISKLSKATKMISIVALSILGGTVVVAGITMGISIVPAVIAFAPIVITNIPAAAIITIGIGAGISVPLLTTALILKIVHSIKLHYHTCFYNGMICSKQLNNRLNPIAGSCKAIATTDCADSLKWRKKLIEKAEHNIIISGHLFSGHGCTEVLEMIDEKMKNSPDLKVLLIGKPLNHKLRNKMLEMTANYPKRFNLIESSLILHCDKKPKVSINHAKGIVIDYGKYFMTGGSILYDRSYHTGIRSLDNKQQDFPPPGFYFRDMDFVFKADDANPDAGKSFYRQMLLLCYEWEQYLINKSSNQIVTKLRVEELGVFDGKEIEPKDTDSLTIRLLRMPIPKWSTLTMQVSEFDEQVVDQQSGTVQLYNTHPGQSKSPFAKQIIKRIKEATQSIKINHMYFHPTNEILEALKEAANRGVKITLITTGKFDNGGQNSNKAPPTHAAFAPRNKKNYYSLYTLIDEDKRENLTVYEFEQDNVGLHKKVIIIDDTFVLGGSSNLGTKGMVSTSDYELNFEAESKELAKSTEEVFNQDIIHSQKVDVETKKPSLMTRIRSGMHETMGEIVG